MKIICNCTSDHVRHELPMLLHIHVWVAAHSLNQVSRLMNGITGHCLRDE